LVFPKNAVIGKVHRLTVRRAKTPATGEENSGGEKWGGIWDGQWRPERASRYKTTSIHSSLQKACPAKL